MKNISVTTFIHTLFAVVVVILGVIFYYLISSSESQRKLQQINRYKVISDNFLTNEDLGINSPILKKIFKTYQIEPIELDSVKKEIEKSGITMFSGKSIYGDVRVFKTTEHYYIYVERFDYSLMMMDKRPQGYISELLMTITIVLILILLFMYIAVLKKLYPLKKLHKQIEQFANSNLDIKIEYDGNDEIGKIAKSFNKAIRHIRHLISSKNLFMRNIMHELKTPITKGRIIIETIDDEVAKRVLKNAFERMNELISDLAEVERITMYNFAPEFKNTTLSEIMEETTKVLMTDKVRYSIDVQDRPIYTDPKLLALVLKNLMDNGIKYSSDKFVKVKSVGGRIEVRSKGEPLKEKLSYYTEPFSQEEKRSQGFGLGLYIVANVVEKLNYSFRYRYDKERGENVFEVIME